MYPTEWVYIDLVFYGALLQLDRWLCSFTYLAHFYVFFFLASTIHQSHERGILCFLLYVIFLHRSVPLEFHFQIHSMPFHVKLHHIFNYSFHRSFLSYHFKSKMKHRNKNKMYLKSTLSEKKQKRNQSQCYESAIFSRMCAKDLVVCWLRDQYKKKSLELFISSLKGSAFDSQRRKRQITV